MSENHTATAIEKQYMKKERKQLYLALEEFDFSWCSSEVRQFEKLWKEGKNVYDIAEHFDRDIDEVVLLVLDRCRKGTIKKRKGGLNGYS